MPGLNHKDQPGSKYRNRLPQLKSALFVTDGGLETTLIFHNQIELPYFAAFDLLKDDAGTDVLRRYFRTGLSPEQKADASDDVRVVWAEEGQLPGRRSGSRHDFSLN